MREYLPAITLACLFLFGCVMAGSAIGGMRSGRFWYKTNWITKGGDGILFWVIVITVATAGGSVALGALWFAFNYGVFPPPR